MPKGLVTSLAWHPANNEMDPSIVFSLCSQNRNNKPLLYSSCCHSCIL